MIDPRPINPTLEVLRNNRTLRLIEMKGVDLHIGRIPGFDVYLEDVMVSRHHARIERRADGIYYLVDLDSQNCTYLDGQRLRPFQPVPLRDRSRIKILKFELIFHLRAFEVREGNDDGTTVLGTLADLGPNRQASRALPPLASFQAVLDVNRALGGGADLNEMLGRALDGLMAVFARAESGFLLTIEADGSLQTRAIRQRPGAVRAPALSRTMLKHVLTDNQAVLITDLKDDERFKDSSSLAGSGVRTAICVPLPGHDGRPVGIAQLDSRTTQEGFSPDELELFAALALPVGVAFENHRLLQERASWAAAREIQLALLPRHRPEIAGYEVWECYRPALEVGGDLYDYIAVETGDSVVDELHTRWVFSVGDVAGKGMPAALLMASICPEVRHLVRAGADPSEVLGWVNRHIFDAHVEGRFVTMVLAELDAREHRVRVANAGHVDALLRRADGTIEEVGFEGAGPPLGIVADACYRASSVHLRPGDLILLYSDGVTDSMDRQERTLGIDRLLSTLAGVPAGATAAGEAILTTIRDHSAGRAQFDDITLVCISRGRG